MDQVKIFKGFLAQILLGPSLNTLYHIKYLIGLLQLFKILTKTLVKELVLQQKLQLLSKSFIRGRSRNPVTGDMVLFGTIVHSCKI